MDNKVINQLHMREMNLNEVLKIIREEESLTRRKLQDLTGFSWGGVSQIVTRLLSQNLIIEVKDTSPGPGRKPTDRSMDEHRIGDMLMTAAGAADIWAFWEGFRACADIMTGGLFQRILMCQDDEEANNDNE